MEISSLMLRINPSPILTHTHHCVLLLLVVSAYKVDSPHTALPQTIITRKMFVYGIRCAPADLMTVLARVPQGTADADYYMDYGLLVFPQYTRPSTVQAHCGLTSEFWQRVRRIVESPGRPHAVDLEHPWITDQQSHVVGIIKDAYPTTDTNWYYVPVVSQASSTQG
jgi:hypothetical protein